MISNCSNVILCRSEFAKWKNPKNGNCEVIEKFTWKTINKMEISLITFGARLIEIKVPDRYGIVRDILLGYDRFEDYARDGVFHFGAITGPVSGIIKNAEYCLKGRYHKVQRNFNKTHCIDSGNCGFHKQNWSSFIDGTDVILNHITDGSQGFPAIILTQIFFVVSPLNTLTIKMTARSNQVTPFDMSQRLYFNLAAHDAGEKELKEHLVTIGSSNFYEKDCDGFYKKTFQDVTGTIKDLRELNEIGQIFDGKNETVDCLYVIDESDNEELPMAVRAIHATTGRILEIYSNQHAMEFNSCSQLPKAEHKSEINKKSSTEHLTIEYLKTKLTEKEIEFFKCCVDCDKIGNKKDECPAIEMKMEIEGPIIGKSNLCYDRNSGFFIACHNHPNAIRRQKKFPEILLKPGSVYENIMVLKFKVHSYKIPDVEIHK